jgi:hypothetical protein
MWRMMVDECAPVLALQEVGLCHARGDGMLRQPLRTASVRNAARQQAAWRRTLLLNSSAVSL